MYPLGVGVGVWDRAGGRHAILHGHTRPVVALAASRSGKLIVSAQDSDPGCQVGGEGSREGREEEEEEKMREEEQWKEDKAMRQKDKKGENEAREEINK